MTTTHNILSNDDRSEAMQTLNDHLLADTLRWDAWERQYIGTASDGTVVSLGSGDSLLAYLLDYPDPTDW